MTNDDGALRGGTQRFELRHAGLPRSYLAHVPEACIAEGPWPVVLAFHGGGTNARTMQRYCGLHEKANEAGFLVVFPEGTGRVERARWFNAGNCCGFAMRRDVDDIGFTRLLLEDLGRRTKLDHQRIYATGMSNGGMMAYRLASELSDRIAAIAPVAGPMGTESCHPRRGVPVLHFHGTDDQFAPYNGGRGARSLSHTDFYSVEHSIQAWVAANGCSTEPRTEMFPDAAADGTTITRSSYASRLGAEVVLYTIHGGGHTWPGRPSLWSNLGKTTHNLSANDVMWEFFQRRRLPD